MRSTAKAVEADDILDWWRPAIEESIWAWYQEVRADDHPARVSYSPGAPPIGGDGKGGLGLSCLMLKTLHMLGLLDRLSDSELEEWIGWIKDFQVRDGDARGYFEDPALTPIWDQKEATGKKDWLTRRAETRQALATLLTLGEVPDQPVPCPSTDSAVDAYLESLPWETDPWGAGSHASHLLSFLEVNGRYFGEAKARELQVPRIIKTVTALRDERSGVWGSSTAPVGRRINGTMKILTGLEFVDEGVTRPEDLIDFALKSGSSSDGCHHADWMFVAHHALQRTSHRQPEVTDEVHRRLREIRQFYRTDGGFSFYRGHTGGGYYGARLTEQSNMGDVHGTTLFVWTLVLGASILGKLDGIGWALPVT